MRNETYELNKRLLTSAIDNIAAWESWANAVPTGAAKILNLSLIRLTKGLVKAWRIFLSSGHGSNKIHNASSQQPSASFAKSFQRRQKWPSTE